MTILNCLLRSGHPLPLAATRFSLGHASILFAFLVCVTLPAAHGAETAAMQAATVAGQPVLVRGGFAQWRGVAFPIYPGVSEVTSLGEGVSYRIPAANRKESVALGSKIAAFYTGKKFGKNAILSEIRKRTYLDHTSFANNVSTTIDL